ncbi:hypothetical protein [Streptomyces sp. SCSIO ZS0520]|uniref:hypothetical protein n=1 Tax=Streptomyces sp. SCSIO ZS0520 TaxID=2892996 RepID=UPI0021D83F92|nr:hypothetical protein [Streptomyces sp. SCSIO ZS0520]
MSGASSESGASSVSGGRSASGADSVFGADPAFGADPLMAALLGEPPADEVRDDAGFRAEHARAVADLDLLREGLATLAEELTGAAATSSPSPSRSLSSGAGAGAGAGAGTAASAGAREPSVPPRVPPVQAPPAASAPPRAATPAPPRAHAPGCRARRLVLGLAAASAAVVLGVVGLTSLGGGDREGAGDAADVRRPEASAPGAEGPSDRDGGSAGGDLSPEGYVACAGLIVEGTVLEVTPVPGGLEERVILAAERYYKPESGKPRVSFVMGVNASSRPRVGDHALIGIPRGGATPDIWSTGSRVAEERAWITAALPKARKLEGISCGRSGHTY